MAEQCCTCQNLPRYKVTFQCGHIMCFICAKHTKETTGLCPMCQQPIVDTIDDFSLELIDNTHNTSDVYPQIKWLYSSRDGMSWWYYDEETSAQIEHYYQNWIELNDPHAKSEVEIKIGVIKYVVNFENMNQFNDTKKRNIIRKTFISREEKGIFNRDVRGIIGVYFDKK